MEAMRETIDRGPCGSAPGPAPEKRASPRGRRRPRLAGRIGAVLLVALALCDASGAQAAKPGGGARKDPGRAKAAGPAPAAAPARVQAFPAAVSARAGLSVVLGRPGRDSASLNLLAAEACDAYVEYGTARGAYTSRTGTVPLEAGTPAELSLAGLAPDREYFYRVDFRPRGAAAFAPGPEGRFRTARAPGSAFSFEIIGDSHPERAQQYDPELYARTLSSSAAAAPDFFMTIGDDFSVDTLPSVTRDSVREVYRRQRLYLSLVGEVAPIFLVNGNHEQASRANLGGSANDVAVWAQVSRNAFFPQPAPDGFYTGDADKVEGVGFLRDYYAWTWGDALFVVIDPYWHSPEAVDNVFGGGDKTRDQWKTTLGDAQYAWLAETLEGSAATWKFVFSHHVSGTGRGGIERAPYFEWGGRSADGREAFKSMRPGWEAPIHELMARNKVTAFVQGHDHLFASQVLDGVAYITLPEPADPNYALNNAEAYKSGDLLPSSGRVRFTVGPGRTLVEYYREWLPGEEPAAARDAEGKPRPAYRLEIPAGVKPGKGLVEAALAAAGAAPAMKPAAEAPQAAKGKGSKTGGSLAPQAPDPGAAPSGSLHARTLVEYPGPSSATLATAFLEDVEYFYRYGEEGGSLDRETPRRQASAGTVARDLIAGLSAGKAYAYRLYWSRRGSAALSEGEAGRFATRKEKGQDFVFAIEADPHFDGNFGAASYAKTMSRIASDRPDFVVDLGDASMVEKLASDPASYLERNRLVRSYWDEVGGRAPFFMAIGNHDGEHGWRANGSKPQAKEAAAMRETWLLDSRNAPKEAYSAFGDTVYAVEWGDALLVVLDPYAAESSKPSDEGWAWTLGKAQYDWLAGELSRSKAAFKFVFIHNMLGGKGRDARGGADCAGLYEWGGKDPTGRDSFAARRPDWPEPVAALLARNGVDVVFRGHDHFYAREEAGGVVYQLVPQPSAAASRGLDRKELAEYGYTKGDFLPSPGYLRVSVSPARARVEYLRSEDGAVAASYDISP